MTERPFKKHNAPTAIVVFGGTGDLASTKLLPALLDLYVRGALPDSFVVIGLSRKEFSDSDYQDFVRESISKKDHDHDSSVIDEFCAKLRYVSGSFDDPDSYVRIKAALAVFDESIGQCTNKLFYLAVPPQFYETIFDQLHESQAMALCDGIGSWSRLLVEKPFGKDLLTAQALEKQLTNLFGDDQIYRIDHYLAKDAIENIISLRFANNILADSWRSEMIESIEIRLLETKDVSNRGSFYDGIGTLRDVGQNHMLQMLALLTMSSVDVHDAHSVRTARTKALQILLSEKIDSIVRGQYVGYTETEGVADNSQTETYFKVSLQATSLEWKGVRFTLEAGKALDRQVNEAVVTFKPHDECHCAFADEVHSHSNLLKIEFSPEQKISLSMWTKKPGFTFELQEQILKLLSDTGVDTYSPEAYERVLFDCIAGDQTRFVSGGEVEASWRFITPILEAFADIPLHKYEAGSNSSLIISANKK